MQPDSLQQGQNKECIDFSGVDEGLKSICLQNIKKCFAPEKKKSHCQMTHFDFISTQLYTNTNKLWVNQCVFAYAKEHPTSNELTLLSPLLPSQYLQAKRSRCFVEVYLSCIKLL